MTTGEQSYSASAHSAAQEMRDIASRVEAAQDRVEALALRFELVRDETTTGEHLTIASTHLGIATNALAAAIEACVPQEIGESVPARSPALKGELVPANAASRRTESGLELAHGLVSTFLPAEVDDRLLTSSQIVFAMTVANRDRGHIGAMGRRGPRDLRDMYMLGRVGLQKLGFGELTLNRIDDYLENGHPRLAPLPEQGDVVWAALLYESLGEVPARVALGDLCDKVLAGGGIGVDAALDALRGRLAYSELIAAEDSGADVEQAIQTLTSFVEQYAATKLELRSRFENFKR